MIALSIRSISDDQLTHRKRQALLYVSVYSLFSKHLRHEYDISNEYLTRMRQADLTEDYTLITFFT